MFNNYLKVALRNLRKYSGFSIINILGLTTGMAASILILLYVMDELSYDRYHEKANQIFRAVIKGSFTNNPYHMAEMPYPMAAALVEDYPEVISATRLVLGSNKVVKFEENLFSENRFYYTDSTFFDIFTVNFIKGDPKTALTQPNTVVITEQIAFKYFQERDPMDNIISLDNGLDYKVTGVVENVPSNSHLHYDFLASMMTYDDMRNGQNWLNHDACFTYILLNKDVDPDKFGQNILELYDRRAGPQFEQFLGVSFKEYVAAGNDQAYYLQSIKDIHLHSNLDKELEANGNVQNVYIFSLIALFIILIACINFTNLVTAKSAVRAKEIAMRKINGSSRKQLIIQFLSESVFLSFVALVHALVLTENGIAL